MVIEYLNSGYNKKLTKIYHFICSNKNDSLVNHICEYKQFTQKYTKLLSQYTNHTIIIHFALTNGIFYLITHRPYLTLLHIVEFIYLSLEQLYKYINPYLSLEQLYKSINPGLTNSSKALSTDKTFIQISSWCR